jgi:hypothetical protein
MGLFSRKVKLPPIGNYPGYEASNSAFTEARATVLSVIKGSAANEWAFIGDAKFIEYVKATKTKLPDKEFKFISTQKDVIWDAFSGYLLRPEVAGDWNPHIYQQVSEILISKFSQMPEEYKPPGSAWLDAANLTLSSLNTALKTSRQILAQPLIEYILIIWLHYCLTQGVIEETE